MWHATMKETQIEVPDQPEVGSLWQLAQYEINYYDDLVRQNEVVIVVDGSRYIVAILSNGQKSMIDIWDFYDYFEPISKKT
jgi:hypothetical protein